MEILNMKFVVSAAKKQQFINDGLQQIVVTGKSNVGKSSFINLVCNNSKMARTSSSPGKTRLVNYFLTDDNFYVVDLPGYGFAKAPKTEQVKWQQMMEDFFESKTANYALHLLDIRHKPTNEDKLMQDYLKYYGLKVIIAATKADKIAKSKINLYVNDIRKELMLSDEQIVIPFSSQNSFNKDLLIKTIKRTVKAVAQ